MSSITPFKTSTETLYLFNHLWKCTPQKWKSLYILHIW